MIVNSAITSFKFETFSLFLEGLWVSPSCERRSAFSLSRTFCRLSNSTEFIDLTLCSISVSFSSGIFGVSAYIDITKNDNNANDNNFT